MRRPFFGLLIGGLILLAPAAVAQPALLADLRPEHAVNEASLPGAPVAAGGRIYFTAVDTMHGRELWVSDLTPEGTVLVRDLCPGSCSGIEQGFTGVELGGALVFSNDQDISAEPLHAEGLWRTRGKAANTTLLTTGRIRDLTRVRDRVVFTAAPDEFSTPTLWASDGTRAGTRSLGEETAGVLALVPAGDRVDFFLSRDFGPIELWTTDGTAAGTSRVAGAWDRFPRRRTSAAGRTFFETGDELWASDGTAAGTVMLYRSASFDTFEEDPFPAVGERIYFLDRTIGSVLWTSDGTVEGTRRVGAVCVVISCSLTAANTAVAGGRLFFVGQDETHGRELWTSDGTAAGTGLVRDVIPGTAGEVGELTTVVDTAAGDVVFFTAGDGSNRTLWVSDGTAPGTVLLLASTYDHPRNLLAAGDKLFFENYFGLWASDGTAAGTRSLGVELSLPVLLTALDDRLFFAAGDLWTSDGTAAGTRVVKDIGAGRGRSSSPMRLAALGGRLYFSALAADAFDRFERELWTSDGTEEGSGPLFAGPPPGRVGLLATLGGRLFFTADLGEELWVSDGTAEGSELVAEMPQIRDMTATSDRLWLRAGFIGGLWTSDGTAAGTVPFTATATGETIGEVTFIRAAGDVLYFLAGTDQSFRSDLWVSDGTAAGTLRLAADVYLPELAERGGTVFFATGPCANELWASDGTAAGTRRLERFGRSGACTRRIRSLAATARDVFVLTVNDFGGTAQLWSSDGTAGGRRRLRTLPAVPRQWEEIDRYDETPRSLLVAAGERVYFAVASRAKGLELWSSDGERTCLVKDVCPGACGSVPHHPEVVDGRLYFSAADHKTGWEPWVSDGTKAGTRRLADVAPGAASSSPREFFAFGDVLLFQADDGVHGSEPWAMVLDEEPQE